MNKIKWIQKIIAAFEKWLVNTDWRFEKAKALTKYLNKLTTTYQRGYYQRYIASKITALNLSGTPKIVVETLANNSLECIINELAVVSNTQNSNLVKPEVILGIVIKAAHSIANELEHIVGIQPLTTPVGQIFTLQYKQVGEKSDTLSLEVVGTAVASATRKLAAGWSVEAVSDLALIHKLDIETELTKAIASEIAYEVVNEIINKIQDGVKTTESNVSFKIDESSVPNFIGDNFSKIGIEIKTVANDIARNTRRGAGNFIICSPMVVSMLQVSAKSVFAPATESTWKGETLKLVGTLDGTIRVYMHLWDKSGLGEYSDRIIVGYKGSSETDAGYIFSPYNLVMNGGIAVNPKTFTPQQELLTRAAHHYWNKDYFQVINFK